MKIMEKVKLPLSKWTNFKKDIDSINIYQVYEMIKSNELKDAIESIQQKILKGKIADAENEKKQLPAVSFCATYVGNRTADNLGDYNGLVILDYDALAPLQLAEVKERAAAMDTSILVFESPSGQGVKVLVSVNSTIEFHEQAFNQVSDLYDGELGAKSDRATKDTSRLCFLSHDKGCYFNSNAADFEVKMDTKSNYIKVDSFEMDMQNAIAYTNNKSEFKDDNRNNYIFKLACNCNRYGFAKDEVLAYLIKHFERVDFSEKEIRTAVEGPYKNYRQDFGTWNKPRSSNSSNNLKKDVFDNINNSNQVAIISNNDNFVEKEQLYSDLETHLTIFKSQVSKISDEKDKEMFIAGCFAGLLLSNKFIAGR